MMLILGLINCQNWKMIYFMKGIEFLLLTLLYGWAAGYFGKRAYALTLTMLLNYILLFFGNV